MYDLIILGGGPAGYLAAERAGEAGMNTLLIEKRNLGGVCLNEGCIPSKTLLNSTKIFDYANGGGEKYGVTCKEASIDFGKVVDRKNKVVKTLVGGIAAKLKHLKVEVIETEGKIKNRTPEGTFSVEAGGKTYIGQKLLICTGSNAILPPIGGVMEAFDRGELLTNREILDLKEVPKRLVVIGGGVIGLEMASVFSSIGSEVTVVEMLDKIAGPTDAEISGILQKNLERHGIKFVLGAKVVRVGKNEVIYEKDGKNQSVGADKVLMSIGRKANTEGIGLENIGVETDRTGIKTDDKMKTNIPGVFAAGDVNGKSMLAHTAYREAEVAIKVMQGVQDRMLYTAIPAVIYTHPEVASVGETVDTAVGKGLKVREVKLSMAYSGRYLAENEGGDGIAKLVLEEGTNHLVGVHLIGNPASEIIPVAVLALEKEVSISSLKKVIFPHPTVAEIIREVIFTA